MEALAIAALLLLPGAWIAFALRDGAAGFGARLAWAIALSPLVVAVEFFLARRAAGSFPQTAWLVAALNAPAVILIWRRWRARIPAIYESSEWEMWRGVLVYAAVSACVALPWWIDPVFRAYSTHGLLQLDVIYAIATVGEPWEAELAGATLTQPWAPHVAWALEAAAAQRSPTLLYPLNNLLALFACGVLAYDLGRALGASKAVATAATALLALGPNIAAWAGWPGNAPQGPLALRFVSFDSVPLGIALELGVALAVVSLVKRPRRQEMLLLAAGLVAMAALCPAVYPAGATLAAGAAGVLGWRARRDEGLRIPAIDVAGWAAAGLIAGYFILHGYSEGRAVSAFAASALSGLGGRAGAALLGLVPFALAGYLYWRARPERRPELAALAIGAGGALACNLVLRLGFIETAGILLIPPALIGASDQFPALKRRVGWVTWGSAAALALGAWSYSKNRLPDGYAPAVDERSFFLALAPGNPDGRWMAAVRVKCHDDTVLVVDRPEMHVSAFTARRLLVGSEGSRVHAGCNQSTRFNLVDLRGYDPEMVDRRLALLDQVYRPDPAMSEDQNAALLDAIAAEAGPDLAFVFLKGDDRSFLDWLQRDRHVRVIYDDGIRTIVAP